MINKILPVTKVTRHMRKAGIPITCFVTIITDIYTRITDQGKRVKTLFALSSLLIA